MAEDNLYEKQEYFRALNGWRFIFSLLMIVHHLPESWKESFKNYDFGNTIVLFFFILSGFLLTRGYYEKLLMGKIKYKGFIVKRISTIFPLQWLLTLLFVLFSINVVTYWAIPFNLTLTQSLVPFLEINFTMNTPAWFLSSIFICYLLTPLVFRFLANYKFNFLLIYLCIVVTYNLFVLLLPDNIGTRWLCYINPFARLIDFSVGILFALYWDEINKIFQGILKNNILATIFELLVIGAVFFFFAYEPIQEFNNYTVLRYPVIILFIIVFALSFGFVTKILSLKLFQKLGDLSIAIYMTHAFVLYFTKKIEVSCVGVNVFLTFVFTLLFAYILIQYYCPYCQQQILKIFSSHKNNEKVIE